MQELSDQLYDEITLKSEQGNTLMDRNNYAAAAQMFTAALRKLPEPIDQWEAYVWLKASIGDAYFFMGDYHRATCEFFDAMNGPNGPQNCFVIFRLGQCLYEQAAPDAVDYLCKAYLLEGESIFRRDDEKYLIAVKSALALAK
ncbi:hypothetical protein [Pseudomonas sp. NPDC089758]|uniref:hypothetical protein n=1 Tax=Pseudomonas sp. NPDC089758 TaxID=3364473 RepID=UPI003813747F